MTKEISRRKFLKDTGKGIGGLLLWSVLPRIPELPLNEIRLQDLEFYPTLTRAVYYGDLLRKLNDYLRQNPNALPAIEDSSIKNWIEIIGPEYVNIGFTDTLVEPNEASFNDKESVGGLLEGLGITTANDELWINSRIKNPFSPWNRGLAFYGAVAHEEAHIQQGKILRRYSSGVGNVEAAAQIGMVTTLASCALTDPGNRLALFSFIYEMQDMTFGAIWYMYLQDPKKYGLGFHQLINLLGVDATTQAILDHKLRTWKDREQQLAGCLLDPYNYHPLQIVEAARNNGEIATDLIFPNPEVNLHDLFYLERHADEMLRELIQD